jgi:uncharacterized protein (DUF2384 family)
MTRQAEILQWAVDTFGPVASHVDERAARLAEEAIEVAQAARVPADVLLKIIDRIYSKPPASVLEELPAVAMTLEALAELVGADVAAMAQSELDRVRAIPKQHWSRRHAFKVAGGTADLSPVTPA